MAHRDLGTVKQREGGFLAGTELKGVAAVRLFPGVRITAVKTMEGGPMRLDAETIWGGGREFLNGFGVSERFEPVAN